MTYTLVVVFLLDTVTKEFPETSEDNGIFSSANYKCAPTIQDAVFETANRQFGLDIKPNVNFKTGSRFDENNDIVDSVVEFENEFSMENAELNNVKRGKQFEDIKCENVNGTDTADDIISHPVLPETSTFLVAIFETLSNITAHTCSGTLLSPNWVLTSENCIDVLGYLRNGTNYTGKSVYTVVAEATNPLVDGSIHNVTQVVLQPDRGATNFSNFPRSRCAGLVMMRIAPRMEGGGLEIAMDEVPPNIEAQAYGWAYIKNELSVDVMKIISIPVNIQLSSTTCDLNCTRSEEELCFTTNDTKMIAQLSLGGAVLWMQGRRARVAAVTRAGDGALSATTVHLHAVWIQSLLSST
ncbi:unnamed protein product [Chilo suppressalis]|uniref:Peptidase S1 domain-containing protein n=1 Tax=Chilo suppressalis TaxID=168631 RepID=A0ABN8AXN0_CHISP|nr:unnamed protein product [Chilo suppressalis]